jgi:hypothetical protein
MHWISRGDSYLFEQLVEVENIGELQLKGFAKPISTFNITALSR